MGLGVGAALIGGSAPAVAADVRPVAAVEDPFESEEARSIVVRQKEERVAQAQPAAPTFDPFDEPAVQSPPAAPDEVAMPAAEPAYDPFEDAEAAAPAPAVEAEVAQPDVQELFEEPQAEAETPAPSEAEELDAAQEAIDLELLRREVEAGAAAEMEEPAAEPEAEADASVDEPAGTEESLEDELAVPGLDEESSESMRELEEELKAQVELTPEQQEERRRQLEEARRANEERCNELYEAVRADSIKSISLDIRVLGNPGEDFPFECTGANPQFIPRSWAQVTYQWKASAMCHKPLYFEQVQLERYGHSWGPCLQPIMSGAHFFATIPILPYKIGLQTPNECVYTLGHYRPGSCAPYMISPPGFTWRAAAFQAGAVTGAAVVVP